MFTWALFATFARWRKMQSWRMQLPSTLLSSSIVYWLTTDVYKYSLYHTCQSHKGKKLTIDSCYLMWRISVSSCSSKGFWNDFDNQLQQSSRLWLVSYISLSAMLGVSYRWLHFHWLVSTYRQWEFQNHKKIKWSFFTPKSTFLIPRISIQNIRSRSMILGSAKCVQPRLPNCKIIFETFPPMWPTLQMDGQTDDDTMAIPCSA